MQEFFAKITQKTQVLEHQLLLIKENKTSQINEFSSFQCMISVWAY